VLDDASLLIEDGFIAAINPASGGSAACVDLAGQILLPGIIDLHCDALEHEVEPRPNVHFPLEFACAQADQRNAGAGVTTVYHAIAFANEELGVRNNAFAAQVVAGVNNWRPYGLVDNRVHCRYEMTDTSAPEVLLPLIESSAMHLFSVMDHSPGQGQYKELASFRRFLSRKYHRTEAELDALVQSKVEGANGALERARALVRAAGRRGMATASHDDDSPAKVASMRSLGIGISEFPINMEAARAARASGMVTVFGAPNILRGKSQSGAMRALDAVRAGLADCLCADYHPATLLAAVFQLPALAGISLPDASRLVSANPARAAGLEDRGEIAVGKRADLVSVARINGLPRAVRVYSAGRLAYASGSCHA
jgi:alpha-D-ribose 1-methylphosphonate 5-triphosphate diphosphatase